MSNRTEGSDEMTARETTMAGRREWLALAVLALPCLLISMDASVLELAVPSISADLKPSSSELLWIMDIYGFLLAGSLLTMGALGDRIGRRRLLLAGAAAFGAASLLAASATSAPLLIASRALLGVAGATLMPSTLSLIRTLFHDDKQRTRAIAIWGTSLSAGGALGPLIGGLLIERFWWGSVFLIAVPIMGLLLVLGPRLLPEHRDPDARPLDIASAALSLVTVLALVYGVKQLATGGTDWQALAPLAGGLAVGAAFVRRQLTLADPLIDLRLFKAHTFDVALATNLLGFLVVFGTGLFMTQYLQLVLGMGPFEAGLWTLPLFAGFIAGSTVTPTLAQRIPPGRLVAGGMTVAAIGLGVIAQVDGTDGLALLVSGSVVMSIGLSPVFTLATDMIVGAAPTERAGAAAAVGETSTELGGALGIAILGSIGTAVYRADIAGALPAGLPPHAAAAAHDTLGGAIGAAGQLPAGVLDAAATAFTHGLQVAVLTGSALLAGTAVLTAILLRPRAETELHTTPRPELLASSAAEA
jgi:DHA2 family multidrug resistance protein-like MFS transporter